MKVWAIALLCFGRVTSFVLQHPPLGNSKQAARLLEQPFRMMAEEEQSGPSLRQLVQKDRLVRKAGVGAGVVCVAAAAGLGCSSGIVSVDELLRVLLGGGTLAAGLTAARFISNEESQSPCPAAHFEVAPSPGKGSGLFATCPIEPGTYLFDYEGEVLDEDAFFARYPNADGRYIAGITENFYIDGGAAQCNPVNVHHAYAMPAL